MVEFLSSHVLINFKIPRKIQQVVNDNGHKGKKMFTFGKIFSFSRKLPCGRPRLYLGIGFNAVKLIKGTGNQLMTGN